MLPGGRGVDHLFVHLFSRCVLSLHSGQLLCRGRWGSASPPPWCPLCEGLGRQPWRVGERTSSAQGDMEQALENYDICTEMLQSSAAAGAEQRDVVICLPNLHNDSVVSLEEVSRASSTVFSCQRPDLSIRTRRQGGRGPGRSCPGVQGAVDLKAQP